MYKLFFQKYMHFVQERKLAVLVCCTISTSARVDKEIPKNLKGKSTSSQLWIARQIKDPYVEKARLENYRCRSAFKLLEIDDKFHIFTSGQIVVDCGAAPGSWSQVAVNKTNADGKSAEKPTGTVIGIDRLPIIPLTGATFLSQTDFTDAKTFNILQELLAGKKIDLVLSDMAPNSTGVKELDHNVIIKLAYSVVRFAVLSSKPGACCLLKIWNGREESNLEMDLARFYNSVRIVKPAASRLDSSETYLLCRGFKGLKTPN